MNGIFTSGLSVDDVYLVLYPMEGIYPDFNVWFYDKIARRHESEERAVFIRHMHGRIAAVAIAKRSDAERKLCTLWVDPLRVRLETHPDCASRRVSSMMEAA